MELCYQQGLPPSCLFFLLIQFWLITESHEFAKKNSLPKTCLHKNLYLQKNLKVCSQDCLTHLVISSVKKQKSLIINLFFFTFLQKKLSQTKNNVLQNESFPLIFFCCQNPFATKRSCKNVY